MGSFGTATASLVPVGMGHLPSSGAGPDFAFSDTWMSSLVSPRCEQSQVCSTFPRPLEEQEQVFDPALNH